MLTGDRHTNLKLLAGKEADKQGGALKKDGAIGKQFTKEGAIGESLSPYNALHP